jgi:hypothetical protein
MAVAAAHPLSSFAGSTISRSNAATRFGTSSSIRNSPTALAAFATTRFDRFPRNSPIRRAEPSEAPPRRSSASSFKASTTGSRFFI